MIEPLITADIDDALRVSHAAILGTQTLTAEEWAELAEHIAQNFALGLADPDAHLALKSVRQGKLAGVILVKQFWNLAELYVDPQWHGQGVGSELLLHALALCANQSPRGYIRTNSSSTAVGFLYPTWFYRFRGRVCTTIWLRAADLSLRLSTQLGDVARSRFCNRDEQHDVRTGRFPCSAGKLKADRPNLALIDIIGKHTGAYLIPVLLRAKQ